MSKDNNTIQSGLDKLSLLKQQDSMNTELNDKKAVRALPLDLNAKTMHIPAVDTYQAYSVSLPSNACEYTKLIFRAILAAHYRYFVLEEFAISSQRNFRMAKFLIDFMEINPIDLAQRKNLLKEYESYRINVENVKPQSTGVRYLILLFENALGLNRFRSTLEAREIGQLHQLTKTKPAPDDEKNALNLNHWFSAHTWLRRSDVGIGNDLYLRLASPKALIGSMRVTVETALISIQESKDVLVEFFSNFVTPVKELEPTHLNPEHPDYMALLIDGKGQKKISGNVKASVHTQFCIRLFKIFAEELSRLDNVSTELSTAMEMCSASNAHEESRRVVNEALLSNSLLAFTNKLFVSRPSSLFSPNFLYELALFSKQDLHKGAKMPVCEMESLLAMWLLAIQTVQPYDIPKMKLSNFTFIKRRNGQITHIESEYFKGRAGSVHQLKTLPMSSRTAIALLRYLSDTTGLSDSSIRIFPKLRAYSTGKGGVVAGIINLCRTAAVNKQLYEQHRKHSTTNVFVEALDAICSKGASKWHRKKANKNNSRQFILSAKDCFRLAHIKTSSIYERTDKFTPTSLLNYNSHTNETERSSYRTYHNQEWQNSCGRITRTVMSDLEVNLFRASESDKRLFNTEFTKAVEIIKNKSAETLACLKVVTSRENGRVDHLGFLKGHEKGENDLPDTIYLQDSPETVMKLKHFLNELAKHHKSIIKSSPEFMLFTALPTAEWIEILFEQKAFSAESLAKGDELYQRYKEILPPQFSSYII